MRKVIAVLIGCFVLVTNINADPYSQVTLDEPVDQMSEVVVTESNDMILPPEMLSVTMSPDNADTQPQMVSEPNDYTVTREHRTKKSLQKELSVDGSVMVVEEKVIKDLINRVTALEVQNHVLQNQLDIISDKLSVSKKSPPADEIPTVNKKRKTKLDFYKKINEHVLGLKKHMGANLFSTVIIGIIVVLVLLLVSIIMPRRKKTQLISYPKDSLPIKDKEEDFDFVDDKDKEMAKLNLARAYIEMGHDSKAQSILYEVLSSGNDEEKDEAKGLLEKIKLDSSEES